MRLNKRFTKAFGDEIYYARKEMKYTQEQVAEFADISHRWYQALESGKRCPGGDILLKLIFVLHIDIAVFQKPLGVEAEDSEKTP